MDANEQENIWREMSVGTANLLVGICIPHHIRLKKQYQPPDCDIWLLGLECETGVPTA